MDPDGCLGWLEIDERLRRAIVARDAERRARRAAPGTDELPAFPPPARAGDSPGLAPQSTPATASTRRIRSAA